MHFYIINAIFIM